MSCKLGDDVMCSDQTIFFHHQLLDQTQRRRCLLDQVLMNLCQSWKLRIISEYLVCNITLCSPTPPDRRWRFQQHQRARWSRAATGGWGRGSRRTRWHNWMIAWTWRLRTRQLSSPWKLLQELKWSETTLLFKTFYSSLHLPVCWSMHQRSQEQRLWRLPGIWWSGCKPCQ